MDALRSELNALEFEDSILAADCIKIEQDIANYGGSNRNWLSRARAALKIKRHQQGEFQRRAAELRRRMRRLENLRFEQIFIALAKETLAPTEYQRLFTGTVERMSLAV